MTRFIFTLIATLSLATSASAHTGLFSHAMSTSEANHLLIHIAMLLPITALATWLGFKVKRWMSN